MTIKIDAPRAYYDEVGKVAERALKGGTHRIIRESDYRKQMKLVRACEALEESNFTVGKLLMLNALDKLRGK